MGELDYYLLDLIELIVQLISVKGWFVYHIYSKEPKSVTSFN